MATPDTTIKVNMNAVAKAINSFVAALNWKSDPITLEEMRILLQIQKREYETGYNL